MRQDFGVDPKLARASRNQLRVLPAKVEDDDVFVVCHIAPLKSARGGNLFRR
jgi:hypothetical protein